MSTTMTPAPVANHAPAQAKATPATPADLIERALGKGDLSSLTAEQRMDYMRSVCESLGLNPLTRPFDFLTDKKGKTTLYARADAARQLAKMYCVTLEIVSKEEAHDLYIVHVRSTIPAAKGGHKRTDEDIGVVSLAGLKGDDRANAIMKAITKAKRRATLSICGLGLLDETEAETVEARPTVTVTTRPAATLALPEPAAPAQDAPATPEQVREVTRLKNELGLTGEAWQEFLAKWLGKKPSAMLSSECAEVIADLKHLVSTKELEDGMGGDGLPNLPPPPAQPGPARPRQAPGKEVARRPLNFR